MVVRGGRGSLVVGVAGGPEDPALRLRQGDSRAEGGGAEEEHGGERVGEAVDGVVDAEGPGAQVDVEGEPAREAHVGVLEEVHG